LGLEREKEKRNGTPRNKWSEKRERGEKVRVTCRKAGLGGRYKMIARRTKW